MGSVKDSQMDEFDLFSPTDFRYYEKDLKEYLTEEAFTHYKVKVEVALVKTLAEYGICPKDIVKVVDLAIDKISSKEVYKEEKRIKHDIRALINVMKKYVGAEAKPYIHTTATSFDVIDTARALMYRDATSEVVLPNMIDLEKTWIELAGREKDTIQIGRTHGQHAEPITFGFAIAQYIERWGNRILKVKESAENLVGKFSGAVGAYNASSLLIENPEEFEEKLLAKLGLKPGRISTQIVPPEPTVDFIHSIVSSFGVIANYADDMRHLQRTEISEVGEPFGKEQVGSSTMPQKRNPINFENVKSAWKEFMPRMITTYMDQISEHQRDLTNSLSQRYIPELLVMFSSSVKRINSISKRLKVDKRNMKRNFKLNADKIVAEPLQILLSFYGHPNAHEKVRQLTIKSYETGKPLTEIIFEDKEIEPYSNKFTEDQLGIISNPEKYQGIASQKAEKNCDYWKKRINDLGVQNG